MGKRGILSAMSVSSMKKSNDMESDVFGECPLNSYSVSSRRGVTTITKGKNIGECKNTNKPFASFFSNLSSGSGQTAVKQNQSCEQTVNNSVLRTTACVEEHLLKPFSSENSGATTRITQSLQFVSMAVANASDYVTPSERRATTLLFEDEPSQGVQQDIQQLQDLY